MANTYVINPPKAYGDQLVVTGTVNAVPVTVNTWVSVAGNALASVVAWQNFIIPLMLAQYNLQLGTSFPALGNTPITITQ